MINTTMAMDIFMITGTGIHDFKFRGESWGCQPQSWGGGATYHSAKFPPSLHENEENWTVAGHQFYYVDLLLK